MYDFDSVAPGTYSWLLSRALHNSERLEFSTFALGTTSTKNPHSHLSNG